MAADPVIPPPPEGFTIVEPQAAAVPSQTIPPLPEGFKLVEPEIPDPPEGYELVTASWKDTVSNIPSNVVAGAEQATGGLAQKFGERDRFPEIKTTGGISQFSGFGSLTAQANPEAYNKAQDELDKKMTEFGITMGDIGRAREEYNTPKNQTFMQKAVSAAGTSLGQMIPIGLAAVVTKSPHIVAPSFGVIEYGRSYSEARAHGLDEDKSDRYAMINGLTETLTEYLPTKYLLKDDIGFKKRFVNFLITEIPGENIAEVTQAVNAWQHDLTEDLTAKDVLETMALTTVSTLMGGSAQVGTAEVLNKLIVKAKEHRARKDLEGVTLEMEKLLEENPVLREVLENDKTLQEIEQLLQQKANDPMASFPTGFDDGKDLPLDKQTDTVGKRVLKPTTLKEISKLRGEMILDSGLTIDQMQPGEVQTAGFNHAMEELKWIDGKLADQSYFDSFGTQAEQKRGEMVERRARAAEELKQDQAIKGQLHGVLNEWVKMFSPTMKVILTTGQESNHVPSFDLHNSLGHMLELGNDTFLIALNKRELRPSDQKGREWNQKAMIEVMAHEFGHSVAGQMFSKAPTEVRSALFNSYKDYLRQVTGIRRGDKQQDLRRKFKAPMVSNLERRRTKEEDYELSERSPSFRGAPRSMPAVGKGDARTEWAKTPQHFRNYLISFDEWFAENAAKFLTSDVKASAPVKTFFARVQAVLERFWRRYKDTWGGSPTFEAYMRNMAAQVRKNRLSKQVTQEQTEKAAEMYQMAANKLLHSNQIDLTSLVQNDMKESLDKFNKFLEYGHTLLQIGQANPHIQGLQQYIATVKQMEGLSTTWKARAAENMTAWRKLGKDQGQRLARFSLAAMVMSEEQKSKLTMDQLHTLNLKSEHKLSDKALELFRTIDGDFNAALQALYKILEDEARVTFAQNPTALEIEIKKLASEFNSMANKNYFPLMRFGDHVVKVISQEKGAKFEGKEYGIGQLMLLESYPTESEAKSRRKELMKLMSRHAVSYTGFPDETAAFMGMPQRLIDKMLQNSDMALTENQRQTLKEMSYEMSSANSFKRQLQRRKMVAGYSKDAMRSYASYFQRFANHLARMKYADPLSDNIKSVYGDVKTLEQQGAIAKTRLDIANFLKEHRDYILNPGNEWDGLKAAGFLAHMAFVPKSIYVNATQLPMVTYPYLAANKEINVGNFATRDARAVAAMVSAMKDIGKQAMNGKGLTADEIAMFDELKKTNILTQSFAMNLAGMSDGGNLQRFLPGVFGVNNKAQEFWSEFTYWGAFGFQLMEEYNRRTTALAAYRMAKEAKVADPVGQARKAVETTQLEYSKWNRAKMFRGKMRSTILLFMTYVQGMLHFVRHDPGRWRYLAIMMLAGGLSGLPFAEDLMDMLDMLLKVYNKTTGNLGTKADIRLWLRQMIQELSLNPDLVMDGLGSEYGLGPLHLLELTGVPFPHVDISGSISMGRIIPGMQLLSGFGQDSDYVTIEGAKDILGAVLSIPVNMYQAMNDNNPDLWKKIEKTIPLAAFKHLSKATRLGVRGKETAKNDAALVDANGVPLSFDPGDPKEFVQNIWTWLELSLIGAGFASSKLNNAHQAQRTANEHIMFYEARRRMLLAQLDLARNAGDREAIADVKQAIARYNATVPEPRLKLGPESILRATMQRDRTRNRQERGLPRNRKNQSLQEGVQDAYREESYKGD